MKIFLFPKKYQKNLTILKFAFQGTIFAEYMTYYQYRLDLYCWFINLVLSGEGPGDEVVHFTIFQYDVYTVCDAG